MNRVLSVLFVVTLVLLVGVSQVSAKDAPKGPQPVTNFGDKPAVTFDHDTHADMGCVKCHHNEADGKYKCGECHKLKASGDAPKIKDAFHKKGAGTCYECHLLKGAEKKMKCKECHAK